MTHTLRRYHSDQGVRWHVGFWQPNGEWLDLLDFVNMIDAAAWVSFLNGGTKP